MRRPEFICFGRCAFHSIEWGSGTRRTPERAAAYQRAIEQGELKLGMSRSEVVQAWGRPQKKDRTRRGGVRVERWWYPSVFVYFDRDGYVSSWDAPW